MFNITQQMSLDPEGWQELLLLVVYGMYICMYGGLYVAHTTTCSFPFYIFNIIHITVSFKSLSCCLIQCHPYQSILKVPQCPTLIFDYRSKACTTPISKPTIHPQHLKKRISVTSLSVATSAAIMLVYSLLHLFLARTGFYSNQHIWQACMCIVVTYSPKHTILHVYTLLY